MEIKASGYAAWLESTTEEDVDLESMQITEERPGIHKGHRRDDMRFMDTIN